MADTLALDAIQVGSRHRKDMGDLTGFAVSVNKLGLLQPAVTSTDSRLSAGERRLRAAEALGCTCVRVRSHRPLNDDSRTSGSPRMSDDEVALDVRLAVLLDHDPALVRHIIRLSAQVETESQAGQHLVGRGASPNA